MGFPRVQYSWRCLEYLASFLFYLSLVGFASSILLGCWAYWLKIYIGDHVNLVTEHRSSGDGYLWPATVSLTGAIVVPAHLFGIGLRGALDKDFSSRRAWRRRPDDGKNLDRLLFLHSILSCLSGILILGICAGSSYYWPYHSRRGIRAGLQKVMRRYPSDESTKAGFDRMQIELECCGVDSYTDWFFLPWTTQRRSLEDRDEEQVFAAWMRRESIDQQQQQQQQQQQRNHRLTSSDANYDGSKIVALKTTDVPYSCCSPDVLRPCLLHYNFDAVVPYESKTRDDDESVSREGCESALIRRSNDVGEDVLACLLFLAAYQLTASIASRLLQTARGSALRANAKGQRFDGWLLGGGGGDSCTLKQQRLWKGEEEEAAEKCSSSSSNDDDDDFESRERVNSTIDSTTKKKKKRLNDGCTTGDYRKVDYGEVGIERYRDVSRDIAKGGERMQIAEDYNREKLNWHGEDERREENFNSTDFYARFPTERRKSTLQDTVERRHRKVLNKGSGGGGSTSLAYQEQQQRRNSAIINKRERPAADSVTTAASLHSTSSLLPSLPSTPAKRQRLDPTQSARKSECPVHSRRRSRRCPVHSNVSAESLPRRSNNRCPVHGEHVNFQLSVASVARSRR